jgi:hypothetical protein
MKELLNLDWLAGYCQELGLGYIETWRVLDEVATLFDYTGWTIDGNRKWK